jgi:hypothetical protein
MEKALIVAYRMNSKVCNYLINYPDKMKELLALYVIYTEKCSTAKRELDEAIANLYEISPDSEAV